MLEEGVGEKEDRRKKSKEQSYRICKYKEERGGEEEKATVMWRWMKGEEKQNYEGSKEVY